MSQAVVLILVSVFAGGVASISGFGIGSFVTPVIALETGAGLAVAAVSIAHFLGTALRMWMWRAHIHRRVFLSFGLASAAAGLVGALCQRHLNSESLMLTFSALLVLAGFTGLTGLSERIRLNGPAAWMAGALSGVFGGLVGNQGGIRSAALLGFELTQTEYVATATAIALVIDLVRMPVYFATQGEALWTIWPLIAAASVGVLIGTMTGGIILRRIPASIFKRLVSGIILVMGIVLFLTTIRRSWS